ncbi:uncharacterized protein LODBEIA_P41980 [Lodderomyces beijingensis]|uniref:Signal recognition particle subunit SRP72 n=1 Tax=Lodderomyces beijingensis TaxID=1775926 RepID=A0ABP0ZP92_9ASCO
MSSAVVDAFNRLNLQLGSSPSEYEKVYGVSYEYLSKVKNFDDLQAFKNCLVSLINLDQYGKAEQLVAKVPKSLEKSLILEISYIYYKVGKCSEILKLYETYESQVESKFIQAGLVHVLIQTYYKLGDYAKALQLNHRLLGSGDSGDEKLDLAINEKAIASQLILSTGESVDSSLELADESSYDLLYNEAIVQLAKSNLAESLSLLQRAHKLCFDNHVPEQELEAEILPINLAISYVYQLKGDRAKAQEILESISVDKVADALLKLIVQNNLYSQNSIQTGVSPNFIERELDIQQRIQQLKQKLTIIQYDTILHNSILLRFATGSLSSCQLKAPSLARGKGLVAQAYKILTALDITYKSINDPSQTKAIGRKLVRYITQQTDAQVKEASVLLLVFVNSKWGNFDQSLPILEKMAQESMNTMAISPGIVGTLVNVYESTQNINKLKTLLRTLVEKFLYSPPDAFKKADYFNTAKIIAMKNMAFSKDSRQLFEYLHEANPQDDLINSVLSNSDEKLTPIEELASSKSVEELLAVNIADLIPNKTQPIRTVHSKNAPKVTKKQRKPTFGKSKVVKPEGELKLDEERWLPMKLRSYCKPSKKKRAGGHQGAVEPTASVQSATSAQGTSSSTSSSSGNKKKKKKGKK